VAAWQEPAQVAEGVGRLRGLVPARRVEPGHKRRPPERRLKARTTAEFAGLRGNNSRKVGPAIWVGVRSGAGHRDPNATFRIDAQLCPTAPISPTGTDVCGDYILDAGTAVALTVRRLLDQGGRNREERPTPR
jgi:hypothetical protein